MHLAQGHEPQRRRRGDPAGRLRARRLPAHRRDRPLLADHAGGDRLRAGAAGRCSASATASRCCSRRGCCPARCCATATCSFHCEQVARPRRAHRHAVHRARAAGAGAAHADRARRRQLLRRRPRCCASSKTAAASSSATATSAARSPTPPTRTARCNNIAGICNDAAQRRRADAAPGARLRGAARQRRRPRPVRVGRPRAGAGRRGPLPHDASTPRSSNVTA